MPILEGEMGCKNGVQSFREDRFHELTSMRQKEVYGGCCLEQTVNFSENGCDVVSFLNFLTVLAAAFFGAACRRLIRVWDRPARRR